MRLDHDECLQVLTAHLGRGPECCRYLGVHGDVEVPVPLHRFIPLLDPVADPTAEHPLQQCRAYVTYPLLRDFVDLLRVGHVLPDVLLTVV